MHVCIRIYTADPIHAQLAVTEKTVTERKREEARQRQTSMAIVGFYMKCQGGAILKIFHTQKYYSLAEVNRLTRN